MPRKVSPTVSECHIHDQAHESASKIAVNEIRQNVCSKGPLTNLGNRYYCLFHLPQNDKDPIQFGELFRSRLRAIENEIKEASETKGKDAALQQNLEQNIEKVMNFDASDGFTVNTDRIGEGDIDIELAETPIYDFRYIWFPLELLFKNYTFLSSVDFSFATFSRTVDFSSVKFKLECSFDSTVFCSFADFNNTVFFELATFNSASFESKVQFQSSAFLRDAFFKSSVFLSMADFSSAKFSSDAYFSSAFFGASSQSFFSKSLILGVLDFNLVVVQGYLHFEAGTGRFFNGDWLDIGETQPKLENCPTEVFRGVLNLTNFRAENPDRISFNKVRLRPHWFVNSDPRKFIFTDVNWENHLCTQIEIRNELDALNAKNENDFHSLKLLTIAFRNLATNAEEFNRFDDASNFRKSAFECELKEKVLKSRISAVVHGLYRALSFYGESWGRAATILLTVIVVFGLFYDSPFASFEKPPTLRTIASDTVNVNESPASERTHKMNNSEGITYSFYVAALQRPDPKPIGFLTQAFVLFETIFAPVQFALLALAIRRKFMR